ncbi:branched-chain-amino-acid aminotransferase protein [Salix suchowensis]|nr:branched-chain-amino-acid aminotransferase protein [Salix suchowensis]
MAEPKLYPTIPPGLHLISAFLSMEPTETLLSLSRECGGGLVTEGVQRFIWEHCISNEAGEKGFGPYLKNFLKKLISEVESRNGTVLDELYEQCGYYMSSLKDNALVKGSARVCKCISFLFPDACELPSCPNSSNLVVPLHCSLNMLEGDTGCSVWPSSLFLSEFVLSFPDIFSNKSCFEVGSGVGLVGICLSHVKASQVILSDGDLSALSNMKINLELNQLSAETNVLKRFGEDPNTVKADMDNKSTVKCFHLPWESATESELQEHLPDIILGADIIYDPSCLPHLVRVLAILLKQKKAYSQTREESWKGQFQEAKHIVVNGASEGKSFLARDLHGSECVTIQNGNGNGTDPRQVVELNGGSSVARLKKRPVAYIASVIRNIDTFNCFLKLAEAANLVITDITEALVPLNLLPYMQSYNRSKQGEGEVEVIHSWSAPRSLSTSLMYSFAQRDDMEVLDEPLYATFLKAFDVERPYREELLSKMESDGDKVVKEIIFAPGEKKYRFCKHMSKQRLPGLPSDLIKKGKHFILIRNPLDILPSFGKVVPPSFLDLGLAELVSIYNDLCQLGKRPPVIDATDLVQNPEATLHSLCEDLGIPFQDSMLRWEAGPKLIDGIWAPWWYKSVHKSTGFSSTRKYPEPFPHSHYDLLEQSLPLYNWLRRHVRQASTLLKTPLPPPDLPVPANEKLLAWVGDEILPRESAKVSVFDSVVQGGDSVWEGLRIYRGKIFKLEEHLDRLFDSAKALAFKNVPTREEVKEAIFRTLNRNGMFDNSHIRLSLTRGKKVTSGMSPAFNLYGCTLIVLPEWKPPVYDNTHGVTLVTATTRRNSPNNLDSKIHHNNLLNNILAKIEGNNANADDAIMLDKDGFVSETNATNIFLVKKGRVLTPHSDYCLPGITRATVMDLVVKEGLVLEERRISLSEFHTADEVWTTGTMGELTPAVKIDGREVGDGQVGPVTRRLQNAYKKLPEESGVPIPSYLEN